jgi:hypothetical protein
MGERCLHVIGMVFGGLRHAATLLPKGRLSACPGGKLIHINSMFDDVLKPVHARRIEPKA